MCRARRLPACTITCPDRGLVLRVIDDGGERSRHSADPVLIDSHCVGLELIIERLREGLARWQHWRACCRQTRRMRRGTVSLHGSGRQ